MSDRVLAELGAELGIRAGRAVFARGTASSPISVGSASTAGSRAGSPAPTSASPSPLPAHRTGSSSASASISTPPTPPARTPSPHPSLLRRTASSSSLAPAAVPTPPRTPPPSRPRAVPLYSPLARTACTPPAHSSPARATRIHPFFLSRPPPLSPGLPRFVATYSSTSESGSSIATSSFDSSFDCQSSPSITEISRGALLAAALRVRQEKKRAGIDTDDAELASASVSDPADALADDMGALRVSGPSKAKATAKRGLRRMCPAPKPAGDVFAPTRTVPVLEPTTAPSEQRAPATTKAPGPQASSLKNGDSPPAPLFSLNRPLAGHFDRPPSVAYTRDAGEADDLVSCLRGPLGFDLEWPPAGVGPIMTRQRRDGATVHYRRGVWDKAAGKYVWPEGRTAVIQVADMNTVVVYHLPANGTFGPGLRAVLLDGSRPKVGVNVVGDGRKLVRDGLMPNTAGLFELSLLAHKVDPDVWGPGSRLIALARLARHYLGTELDKDIAVRAGAWDAALGPEQIEYAANDAYVGVLLYRTLARRAAERGLDDDLSSLKKQSSHPQFPTGAAATSLSHSPNHDNPAAIAAAKGGAARREIRALGNYADGATIAELAASLSVKEQTVQGYVVAAAVAIPPIEFDDFADLGARLLAEIPGDSWIVQHKYPDFFSRLRASLPGAPSYGHEAIPASPSKNHPAAVAACKAGASEYQTRALDIFATGASMAELAAALDVKQRAAQACVVAAAVTIPRADFDAFTGLGQRILAEVPSDSRAAKRHPNFFGRLRSAADTQNGRRRSVE